MVSVIIPAHNEANVIGRCLSALLSGPRCDELQIVVVCNGCTDDTARIARSYGDRVQVVEVECASKTNALNAGDSAARWYPRFYLDADLVINTENVLRVCQAVRAPGVLAAAPVFRFDLSRSSRVVKAYYEVWQRMPYSDSGRIAGAYALSREGRRRFGDFPDVISDDGFARLHFAPEERLTVSSARVIVTPPRRRRELIRIRSRSRVGTVLLRKGYPDLFANENAAGMRSVLRMLSLRVPLRQLAVYLAVTVAARVQARVRLLSHTVTWERDESSRSVSGR
jgi:glycosyltransferase involved in cell wall biosynthesis